MFLQGSLSQPRQDKVTGETYTFGEVQVYAECSMRIYLVLVIVYPYTLLVAFSVEIFFTFILYVKTPNLE